MKRVWYIDSTLRDGEQTPGVSFHPYEKIKIASLLNDLGIDEVEVGTPAMGMSEISIIKEIATSGFCFNTTSWCRANINDIQSAILAKTDGINISFPVSAVQLKALNKTENWIYSQLPKLTKIASDNFEYVAIGLQDASRADFTILKNVISLSIAFGAQRIRIADTVGCLNPVSSHQLFSKLANEFPETDFEFHGHNDLGLATANSLSAILAGASSLSTTINGIGERAGNTSLDEIVMALKYSANIEPSINTHFFQEAANYVSKASGMPIAKNKPITGENAFKHESGIHINSLLKDKSTYQIIDEKETGKSKIDIVFGKHSGTAALIDFFNKKGLNITRETARSILEQIKLQSGIKKSNLPDNEVMELYYQLT